MKQKNVNAKYLLIALFILACLIGFCSLRLVASTYYVAPNGNNLNPGTMVQPWKTPGYGSKQIAGGDTLIILSGVYIMEAYYDDMITPPSGTASQWTVIKGGGTSLPVLKGKGNGSIGLLAAIDVTNTSYIKVENLEMTSLIDAPYSGGLRQGIEAGGSAGEGAYVNNVVVYNIFIHHIEEGGISVSGNASNLSFIRCTLQYTGGTLIGSAYHSSGNGWENVLIDSCYLGYGGHFYNGIEQPSPADRPDGFGIEISDGPIEIRNTIVEHNLGDGLDSKSKRTYIHHCNVQNNFADGVKLWGDSSKVENTLIYGVGDGNPISSPWVLLIIDCDQPNSYFEITNVTMHDGSPRGHYTMTMNYDNATIPVQVVMRNNIIQGNSTRVFSRPLVSVIAQKNLFFLKGEVVQIEANGQTYDSANISSFGIGNFFADARFINPAWGTNGDYHLLPTSPAIDAGISWTGMPTTDLEYLPRPLGSAYDIGCYEYLQQDFAAPILLSPANGATGLPTRFTFIWSDTTAAISYQIQVSEDSMFTNPFVNIGGINDTFFTLSGLTYSAQYFWHVRSKLGTVTSSWSETRRFLTTLPAPMLFGASGISTNPIVFWSMVSRAVSYHVQIGYESSFATVALDDSTVTDTLIAIGTLPDSVYFTRVRAKNSEGVSSWSNVIRFVAVGGESLYTYTFSNRWNLFSIPVQIRDSRFSRIFFDTSSNVWKYTDSYVIDTLGVPGVGYWVKLPSGQIVLLTGLPQLVDTINVTDGWNLIGTLSVPIQTNAIVAEGTTIQSAFYGFENSYIQTETLLPSKGYWIKVSNDGQLILDSPTHQYFIK